MTKRCAVAVGRVEHALGEAEAEARKNSAGHTIVTAKSLN